MNKEFLPHEQSRALKELGFDEPCIGYYVGRDIEVFTSNNVIQPPYKPEMDSKIWFRAPLYQQAFRWFREKYGLSSYVRLINLQGKSYWKIDKVETEDKIKGYSSFENSYEGSELECLKKLIELITK
jgi:hypothetical protein